MSTTPASTVADSEQLIADLQRQLAEREAELAEYKAERDEALQRETATAEVLQVVNSSPGDLAPVFDALLERAMHLCGASFGTLRTCDGEHFDTVASRGVPSAFAEFLSNNPLRARPGRISARILSGEPLVHILDVADDELYRSGDPQRRALVELGGARTSLVVSLTKDRAVLGTIQLYRQHVQPFTDKQIALLQNFAAQAVIAMENARLLTETREALEQQTATAEVLQVINSSPGNLQPVFDAMLEKAVRLCGATYGNLLRYDGQLFSQAAAVHPDGKLAERVLSMKPFPPTAGGPLEQIVNGEEVSTVGSIEESAAYRFRTEFREMVDRSGFHSWLNVALRKEGALLGVITVFRKEAGTFSDKQIALLQNFAAQAVIAMENARLITETREALEQQTATADVLGVINSSPGDLGPVFDAMLEKAIRLCDAVQGALWLIDGEQAHVAATLGLKPEFAALLRERGGPTPPLQRVMRGERVIHYLDTKGSGLPFVEEAVATDVRTLLWVALVREGIPLGAFAIARREVRAFTDKEIALLQNFAAQAVIAIENARLLIETREALEQQTATSELLQAINSSPGDLAPVFDAMLEKATELCEAAFGVLRTWDGDRFHFAAAFGNSRLTEWARSRPPIIPEDASPLGRIAAGEPLVTILDASSDQTSPGFRAMAEVSGLRSGIAVALKKDSVLVGTISVFREEVRPFTDKQIALLQNFAAQAVIAMENARLLGELRERTRDLQESLEYQTATSDVLNVISRSTADVQPVLDTVVNTAVRLCGADTGLIAIREGEVYRPVASSFSAAEPEFWAMARQRTLVPGRNSIAGRVALEGRVLHVEDLAADPDFAVPEAVATGRRTQLGVPLLREGAVLGSINLNRKRVEPFTERQIELVRTFADQAVIAIENARLLGELRQRTDEVADLNRGLQARVAEQVEELGRVGRLKRFLAPQLAELIVSQGDEKILESHRREIVVVFCDLRGHTAFTETAEPEEVLDFLREYHGALGPLVSQFEGTLDQFSGDGIMVFFNDPVPIPDPAARAVRMAMAMREAAGELIAAWRPRGCDLGFGAGIAWGYATLGQIGFSDRSGYTAIGTVCNLAARLCDEAKDGQILVSGRVAAAVGAVAKLEDLGTLELKGLSRPVAAFNIARSSSAAEARPNLTVVGSGPAP